MKTLRLMIIILILIFCGTMMFPFEDIILDDEKRKEYFKNEEKNINTGKYTSWEQGVFWLIPILIPVLFQLIPMIIDYFK